MIRVAAILLAISFFAPALAEENAKTLPKNTVDCAQFKKVGPDKWIEVGTAVFDLGHINDIHLTDQPITPGHYKFAGIDVFLVLESKCATRETPVPEPTPLAMAQTAQKGDLKQERSAAAASQDALPAANEPAPATKDKVEKGQPERKCEGRKSVYIADAPTEGSDGSSLFEIALENTQHSAGNSDFVVRGLKNNEVQWAVKGEMREGRLMFTYAARTPNRNDRQFRFASMPSFRQRSVALTPIFIKPNREGTGDAILYLSGLQALFAPQGNARRFEFEGKHPSEVLPETFYFDRCE